jgi:hypothetical protein
MVTDFISKQVVVIITEISKQLQSSTLFIHLMVTANQFVVIITEISKQLQSSTASFI